MGSLAPIIAELEKMRDLLWARMDAARAPLFLRVNPNPRPLPLVSVASRGRKKTITGWYTPPVWAAPHGNILAGLAMGGDMDAARKSLMKQAEIVIASEIIHDPVLAVVELARQLTVHRHPDLCPKGFYYDAHWRSAGRLVGCTAQVNPDQPSRGWSKWVPTQEFVDWVNKTVDKSVFYLERDNDKQAVRKGSRMKKWECGCTVVRCAVRLEAVCLSCKKPFAWAEAEGPPSSSYQRKDTP